MIQEIRPNILNKKILSVKIATPGALEGAISAGADYIYLSGEISPKRNQKWTLDQIKRACDMAHKSGKGFGLGTPRITTEREINDVRSLLEAVKASDVDSILVHNLGTLRLARELGYKVIADFSFNVMNRFSASMLNHLGANMVTASIEASFDDLCEISSKAGVKVECLVHGPIPFMVLEHCLPAMLITRSNANDVCRQPCRYINFALMDEKGEVRPIEEDQYCRNHIFFATDLCVLPYISSFMMTEISSFRIEAQYYNDELIYTIVHLYRRQIDMFDCAPYASHSLSIEDWDRLVKESPRRFSLGAYRHGVIHSKRTVEVLRSY